MSTTGRFWVSTEGEEVVRKLTSIVRGLPWRTIIERVCRAVADDVRKPEPAALLVPRPLVGSRHLVEPFVPLGDPAVLYADGGSGKGWIALSIIAAVTCGVTLPGGFGASCRVPVLYLDWETNQPTIEDRLHRLGCGLGVDLEGRVHYRRMFRSLADEIRVIKADVSRYGIGFITVDSLGPACGAEPESAGAAIQAMNGLRSLPSVSSLALAHVSKVMADQKGATRPYGSVFIRNIARSAWEARARQDGNTLTVALHDQKENDGPRRPQPVAFRFTFESGRVLLGSGCLADAPELMHPATIATRVLAAMADGEPRTATDLSGFLDCSTESVGRTLRGLAKAEKVDRTMPSSGGKGHETLWVKRA